MNAEATLPLRLDLTKLKESADHLLGQIDLMAALARPKRLQPCTPPARMAGIFGPVLVNYIREYNITHGVPKAQAYNVTMYIMAGLFVIGFICNLLIKAVDKRFHMEPNSALVTAAEAGREVGAAMRRSDSRVGRT